MPNHFVEHLMDTVAVNVQIQLNSFSKPLSFSSELVLDLASTTVAPCSLFPPYPCAARSPGGLRVSATSRGSCATCERWQQRLCGCQREAQRWTAPSSAAQATGGRRVATHSPVRAAILRRELLGAERALCRRRARTAAPSRIGALRLARPRFSGGTAPVIFPDGA